MSTLLNNLDTYTEQYTLFHNIIQAITTNSTSSIEKKFIISGITSSFATYIITHIVTHKKPFVIIVPNDEECIHYQSDLAQYGITAMIFPSWGNVAYHYSTFNNPVFGKRVHVLSTLLSYQTTVLHMPVIIIPMRSFMTPLPPPHYLRDNLHYFTCGDTFDPYANEILFQQLGYVRVSRVQAVGEFALRGEVLDIFIPGSEFPYRLIFEYNTIEAIRSFHPNTQVSIKTYEQLIVHPLKEVIWDEYTIDKLITQMKIHSEFQNVEEHPIVQSLQAQAMAHGEELFYPLISEGVSIVAYLPEETQIWFAEYERCISVGESIITEYHSVYHKHTHSYNVPVSHRMLLSVVSLIAILEMSNHTCIYHCLFRDEIANEYTQHLYTIADAQKLTVHCDGAQSFFGNINLFKTEMNNLIKAGYTIFILADNDEQVKRMKTLLGKIPSCVMILPYTLSNGFRLPDILLCVVLESEIFGRRRRVSQKLTKQLHNSRIIESFIELNQNDYVVHIHHGIGRFLGIERKKTRETERDYIKIEYSGEEFVFVPIDQVNMVQKYIGSLGKAPALDVLGGKSWSRKKARIRAKAEDMADELITLYARRQNAQGHAFSSDGQWQVTFEASFPFEETEDQIRCINEVKIDMEKPIPMDRLICGDVGFGKTEIAMRAAFKAVADGKQVAVLAPTTILVEQHFASFEERMQQFPIKIGMLSRFVSKQVITQVCQQLARGEIDIIIGTHRLLQKDIMFHDVGLLIIDEEQRFGVKHKECIHKLKAHVDTLTLSATPIPRTLHMSLLSIRDLSLLNTPPYNRRPIQTIVQSFNNDIVHKAITQEIERHGQVFYLHNRIETLEYTRNFLQELLPHIYIETMHGKMSVAALESIMYRFVHGGFQVLVATTIIENGINIPNVNTIIIDQANYYGISQLYQLRGRVGRSDRLAYAYLLYPHMQSLSEIAMKRLQTIQDNTSLGAGFKIAMKDLEIRGAGNLLGKEQSGEIASVGFELYMQLLDNAVRNKKGEQTVIEPYLDLEYQGYIPDEYIADISEKMAVYKQIASINTNSELEYLHGDLEDRYGPLPNELISLISLAEIRMLCKRLCIQSIREEHGTLRIEFVRVADINIDKVMDILRTGQNTIRLDPQHPNILLLKTEKIGLAEKSDYISGKLNSLL